MRTPTFAELKKFCDRDGWTPSRHTDHWFYKKLIAGTLRTTKISFGTGQINDPGLFAFILREQLIVDATEFWRVVDHGGPAKRPTPAQPVASADLPTWLTAALTREGVQPEKIWKLGENEARQLLDELRSRPRP